MRSIIKHALMVTNNPNDYNVRSEIMWGATMAHNGLLGVGREEDWASHAIEHELSGIYDIAHGAGLAIVFPAWMTYVYNHDKDRFVRFANKVFGVSVEVHMDKTINKGIEELENFFVKIGLKTKLKDVKIDRLRFEEIAKKA